MVYRILAYLNPLDTYNFTLRTRSTHTPLGHLHQVNPEWSDWLSTKLCNTMKKEEDDVISEISSKIMPMINEQVIEQVSVR